MIVIKFFASLREQLDTSQVEVSVQTLVGADTASVTELITAMSDSDEKWKALSAEHLLVAVNQNMSSRDTIVKEGDELAFFPAVTGG